MAEKKKRTVEMTTNDIKARNREADTVERNRFNGVTRRERD